MTKMKVIFLDVDGVMIVGNERSFHPECVKNLKEITRRTGAFIVVSSTYRQMGWKKLTEWFAANGVSEGLIGMTPMLNGATRGEEIRQYIEESKLDPSTAVDQFVIIDDHDNMGPLRSYLVQTDRATGLDQTAKERAIAMLNDH